MKRTICLWYKKEPLDESILQEGYNLLDQVLKAKDKALKTCEIVARDKIPYINACTQVTIHEGAKTILRAWYYDINSNIAPVDVDSQD